MTFGDELGGRSSANLSGTCLIRWTNSFIEVSTVLERNAREHQGSFVLYTGDTRLPTLADIKAKYSEWLTGTHKYSTFASTHDPDAVKKMVRNKLMYDKITDSPYNFRVLTLDGVDGDDGMRPR